MYIFKKILLNNVFSFPFSLFLKACFSFVIYSHRLFPHNLPIHDLLTCSFIASLLACFSICTYLLICLFAHCLPAYLLASSLSICITCHALPTCVAWSFTCRLFKYPLNLLFLVHHLLLYGTTPLFTCVGSKARNKEANSNSS